MLPIHVPRFKQVVILCPEAVTGGPEALHQLSSAINRLGGRAIMAYYGGENVLQFSETKLQSLARPGTNFRDAYASYNPITETETPLDQDSIVVFPEVLSIKARNYNISPRAIWWLSVDNALVTSPLLGYPSSVREFFIDDTLLHFYQSFYAQHYLTQQGARQVLPLFDYVARDYRLSSEAASAKAMSSDTRSIAIFPRKGAELARPFVDGAPDLSFRLIDNMTRAEVGATLAQTSVYIDFGHQPGKDRVPREAALAGNIVFLHEKGAGAHFGDYPLDRFYLFTADDIISGSLRSRVLGALSNYSSHLIGQLSLRQKIILEEEEFDRQVAAAFFVPAF